MCVLIKLHTMSGVYVKRFTHGLAARSLRRMPKTNDLRVQLVAPATLMKRVDDWRRKQADLPNRSEAIRRLIEAGLEKPK